MFLGLYTRQWYKRTVSCAIFLLESFTFKLGCLLSKKKFLEGRWQGARGGAAVSVAEIGDDILPGKDLRG